MSSEDTHLGPFGLGIAWQMGLIAATWGTAVLFIKMAMTQGVPPFALAALRGGIAGIGIGAWLLAVGRPLAFAEWRECRHALVLGVCNGLIPNVMLALALTRIDSAPAALIQASTPLIVTALALIFLPGEKSTPRHYIGILLGLAGVALLIGADAILAADSSAIGALLVAAAACSYAISAVYIRITRPKDPAVTAFGQQVVATSAALTLTAIFEPTNTWSYYGKSGAP